MERLGGVRARPFGCTATSWLQSGGSVADARVVTSIEPETCSCQRAEPVDAERYADFRTQWGRVTELYPAVVHYVEHVNSAREQAEEFAAAQPARPRTRPWAWVLLGLVGGLVVGLWLALSAGGAP